MTDKNRGTQGSSSGQPNPQGSGSDTVSAANISAGTSVGNAGQPARPHDQRSEAGLTGQGSGQSNLGLSGGSAGQGAGTGGMGHNPSQSMNRTGQGTESFRQGAGSTGQSTGEATENLRSRAGETLEDTSEWARDQYESASRQLDQVRDRSMQQFRQARSGVERFINENPVMVGVVGLAAGLIIGALLPRTRQEDRTFGRWADEVRDQGMRYAREVTQRGREYVEEAFGGSESDYESESDWRAEDENRGMRGSGPRYQNH